MDHTSLEEEEDRFNNADGIVDLTPKKLFSSNTVIEKKENEVGIVGAIPPTFYFTAIFLIVATLLQIMASSDEEAGPFDWFAEVLIPRFLSYGIYAGGIYDNQEVEDDAGIDGSGRLMCPPDEWIEETFVAKKNRPTDGNLYSSIFDPRNTVSEPTLFPHCALQRWVQLEKEYECPSGEEYVTVIYPPAQQSKEEEEEEEGKTIPNIIHLSSPTNCLPSSTIQTLRKLLTHERSAFTIYVHSDVTMDNFLFQREWTIFPQVKESVLCGVGKLNAVTSIVLKALKIGPNSTSVSADVVDEVSLGVKRDMWRYMVLWEYGGITMDVNALHTILEKEGGSSSSSNHAANNSTNDHGGYRTMRKLMQQWHAEESDGLLYFINNVKKQRMPFTERIPLTDIMAMAPHHPLVYYSAKVAFRIATWDDEKSIGDMGRNTKVPPINKALKQLNRGWQYTKTGEVLEINNADQNSLHFVDGDDILPPALTSPRTTPWRSIVAAFYRSGNAAWEGKVVPSEESINHMMRNIATEQKYIPRGIFSCMEYTLDMYLQSMTVKV
mmetsp:Transcript_7150/g.15542  ORF Transcript_7150/g.15542 Transcript_7150/m.15542 type:complete len:551 (-) Transcript_7150:1432-3084(-)